MSHTFARRVLGSLPLAILLAPSLVTRLDAQGAATSPPATSAMTLKVGDQAPDFALRGATRYGLLENPVRLSDYRGQTVVLAFFFKARTKG